MRILVEGSNLHVELAPKEKFFAFKRSLIIPLDHVVAVFPGRPVWRLWRLRAPGTFFPGIIKAGTYYTRTDREFWYVKRGEQYQTYTIELRNEPYARLVLSVESIPRELENMLTDA